MIIVSKSWEFGHKYCSSMNLSNYNSKHVVIWEGTDSDGLFPKDSTEQASTHGQKNETRDRH